MHEIIKLDSAEQSSENASLNFTADMLVVQNLTAQSLLVRVGGLDVPTNVDNADIYVPPFSSITYSVNGTQFAFGLGLPEVSPIPAGSPTTALITLSQNEPVPTFSGLPVTSVSADVSGAVDANITNPSLDTFITNASLSVSGNMNANITNASINASVLNAALGVQSLITQVGTYHIVGTANVFNQIVVPNHTSGLFILSSSVVNNYSILLVGASAGKVYYQDVNQPHSIIEIFPFIDAEVAHQYNLTIFNNISTTVDFTVYAIIGSLPVLTQPVSGFERIQQNILATGRSSYQNNTANSAAITRFTIPAAGTGQVLVLDSIFGDSGPNLTSNTAAYIRLQTSDTPPVILFEIWSPFTGKDVIHTMAAGPIYISPGVSVNCITSNGASGAVLQTCTVTFHYQIQ